MINYEKMECYEKKTIHGKYICLRPVYHNPIKNIIMRIRGGIVGFLHNSIDTIFRPLKPCTYCQRGANFLLDTQDFFNQDFQEIKNYSLTSYYNPYSQLIETFLTRNFEDLTKKPEHLGVVSTYVRYCPMCGRKLQDWETSIPVSKEEIAKVKIKGF
jgi:hypothetical protein